MGNDNKRLEFIKKSLEKQIRFINYKRLSLASDEFTVTRNEDDLLQNWDTLLRANEKYNFMDVNIDGLSDYSVNSLVEYKNMLMEMITSKGISKDIVLGVSEILDMVHKCTGRNDFDSMSVSTLEMYCNMYMNNPMEFFQEVAKPIDEVISDLKQKERVGIRR